MAVVTPFVKSHKPPAGERARRASAVVSNPLQPYDRRDPTSGQELYELYNLPSKNPLVKSAIDTIISAVFWVDWQVAPQTDTKENPEYEAVDNFVMPQIESQLKNLRYETLTNTLKAFLRSAMVYGVAAGELNWERQGLFWTLESIKHKPSYNFDIYINEFDEITQLQWRETGHFLDPQKFVIAPWPELAEGNWYGRSDLQSIIHDVELLEKLEKARAKGAASLMINPLIHHYVAEGREEEEVNSIKGNLEKIYNADNGALINIPTYLSEISNGKAEMLIQDKLEVMPSRTDGKAMEHLKDIISQHEKRITRALGIPDELGQTTTTTGSNAKALTQFEPFMAKIVVAQRYLANVVNRCIIPQIIQFNYRNLPNGYVPPKWRFQEVEEDAALDQIQFITSAIDKGIITATESWVRDRLGFPEIEQEEINA